MLETMRSMLPANSTPPRDFRPGRPGPRIGLATLVLSGGLAVVAISEPGADARYTRSAPSKTDPAATVPHEMRFIPGGTATIGLDQEELAELRIQDETDAKWMVGAYPKRRDVAIEPFYLDTYEVTNEQWQAYLETTGQQPNADLVEFYWTEGKIPEGHAKRPVVLVSATEAKAFAKWALKRLPDELEWEYAARGTEGLLYPWGNDFDDLDPDQKFDRDGKLIPEHEREKMREKLAGKKIMKGAERANTGVSAGKREAAVVGTHPDGVSPFGIHDLAGNVWEWTASPYTIYDPKNFEVELKLDPRGKAKKFANGFFNSSHVVFRGGSFVGKTLPLVAAYRQGEHPASRDTSIGFRCARSARPGLDVVRSASDELGTFNFRNTPLDLADIHATEHVVYDAQGLIRGSKHFALAGAIHVLKDAKAVLRFAEIRTLAQKSPLYLGVVASTEPIAVPRVPPGTYAIAYFAKDEKAARTQKELVFPKEGWNYHGLVLDDKNSNKKPEKKGGKAKDEPAEPGPAEGAEDEEAAPPEAQFQGGLGSIQVDRSRDAVLLIDAKGAVVASLPIADLKEMSSPAGAITVERLEIKEDRAAGVGPTDRLTYLLPVECAGRRSLRLELPLRFQRGAFDPPPAYTPAKAAATR
jgi:formylglycine-generating enzyme required for sulfatase activity